MSRSVTSSGFDIEYNAIVDGIAEGKVVPFLGAGFNLSDRPPSVQWEPGCAFLPSGSELAAHLAQKYKYPLMDRDLARICQFIVEVKGLAPLYSHLRSIFDVKCELTSAHRFIAGTSARLRSKNYPEPNLLIVTTNYDDLVESAFAECAEPLDVVSYVADARSQKGKFVHHLPDGSRQVINRPNEYCEVSLKKNCVLLKIHGALDRLHPVNDSFVITEDHYIDFLTRTDLSNLVPVTLAAHLRASHFLFMGYSLRDWNLRVVLQRIWEEQRLGYNSWAIQHLSDALDRRFWSRRNVEIVETPLSDCIAALDQRLSNLQPYEEL